MTDVRVDRTSCEGHGNCVWACPGVFELDDDGLVVFAAAAAASAPIEAVQRAANDCPTQSITVDE
jgi:ferredoxin